jgi:hypothetical protein
MAVVLGGIGKLFLLFGDLTFRRWLSVAGQISSIFSVVGIATAVISIAGSMFDTLRKIAQLPALKNTRQIQTLSWYSLLVFGVVSVCLSNILNRLWPLLINQICYGSLGVIINIYCFIEFKQVRSKVQQAIEDSKKNNINTSILTHSNHKIMISMFAILMLGVLMCGNIAFQALYALAAEDIHMQMEVQILLLFLFKN